MDVILNQLAHVGEVEVTVDPMDGALDTLRAIIMDGRRDLCRSQEAKGP